MEKISKRKSLVINNSTWVHFVAIGGTGMGALASMFKSMGAFVTGSDGPLYPPMSTFLDLQKIPLTETYDPINLTSQKWGVKKTHPDLVIMGNAISRNNPEAQEVEKLEAQDLLVKMSFPEALGEYAIGKRKSFVVSGTHGKSTTSSLMAWAFEVLKQEAGFFIGAIPKNFEIGSRLGAGPFVLEGDEYDTAYWDKGSKFLHYRPTWTQVTGIEFDHADIFSSIEPIEKSFLKLMEITGEGALLVDRLSAPNASSMEKLAHLLEKKGTPFFRYGEDPESDYSLMSWESVSLPWNLKARGLEFLVSVRGEKKRFITPMLGKHNLLNAVGVLGTLHASGYLKRIEDFQDVLSSFKGVARRQDILFESDSLIVVDDFAHHPTAIKETIAAVREKYPDYSLAAFFEPRSATSARNLLYKDFARSFLQAESVFMQKATKKNVPEQERLQVSSLVEEIKDKGETRYTFCGNEASDLLEAFRQWRAKKNKVVALVMSNGAFSGLTTLLGESR